MAVGEITAKQYFLQLASACDDACMSLVITAFSPALLHHSQLEEDGGGEDDDKGGDGEGGS